MLREGYWYWRDNQCPIVGAQAQTVTELHLAGVIHNAGEQIRNTEVFIRNSRNGQLEAAITDDQGYFETAFHVLNWRASDRFEVRVGAIDSAIVQNMSLNQSANGFVVTLNWPAIYND